MKWYWLIWFTLSFIAFIIPESWAIITRQPCGTLSCTIWNLESLKRGEHVIDWSAGHFLLGLMLIVLLGWLIGHLVFGIWR